jgi:branched-chain amino acid transport system ATP-binding protein
VSALLEADDLVAGYGDAIVLNGVALRVAAGKVTALIGGNGAGKTTLMRVLAGTLAPRRGSIRFAGASIAALPSHARVAAGIALVPEGRLIFPHLTVEENLRLGAITARARAGAARRIAEAYALFPRLAERRRQLGGTLSGGEQQMLAIARGLMSEPRLLLLDEPTLGLAPIMARLVFDTVAALKARGLTILLAEQNVQQSLAVAEHAFVVENGRIGLAGPARDIARDPRVREAYLGL